MNTIFVANLAYHVTEEGLRLLFSRCGEVESVRIIYDHDTKKSKGYGFIRFQSALSAAQAIDVMNGEEFQGRNLTVAWARQKIRQDENG